MSRAYSISKTRILSTQSIELDGTKTSAAAATISLPLL